MRLIYEDLIKMNISDKEIEFEKVIAQYSALISKICYYFSNNSDEFKDLRQELLLNIWKGWDSFRNESKISSWIYRICFKTCISYQRKEGKIKHFVPLEEAYSMETEKDVPLMERYLEMHRRISKLSYEERAIILMWLDERSYDEIANLMGMKRNTVAVRLKRIKEKIVNMA